MSSILMNGAPGSFSRQQSFKPPPMGAFAFAPAHPSSLGAGASVHSLQSSKTKNHANPMQRGGEKTAVPAHHQAKHSAANHHRGASVEVSNDRRRTSLDLLHPQGSASANVQVPYKQHPRNSLEVSLAKDGLESDILDLLPSSLGLGGSSEDEEEDRRRTGRDPWNRVRGDQFPPAVSSTGFWQDESSANEHPRRDYADRRTNPGFERAYEVSELRSSEGASTSYSGQESSDFSDFFTVESLRQTARGFADLTRGFADLSSDSSVTGFEEGGFQGGALAQEEYRRGFRRKTSGGGGTTEWGGQVSHVLAMLKKGASVRVALGGGVDRKLNVREWNKVIQTAGMTRGWKDAWAVFTSMKKAYLEGMDCRPDERTYTTVITILGGKKVEEIEEMDEGAQQERTARTALAIQLFEEIAESGLEQDQFAYNALMGVLSNAGDHARARALLQRMRHSSAPPDLITYGKVTDACVRGGVPLGEVLQLFDEMQTVDRLKPDMDRFHELVAALCEQKMVSGAQKVLHDMRAAGAVPLRKTYLALLELYAREGLWREAEGLRKDMVAAGLDPNGKDYECLIEAYVTGGRLSEGLATLRQLAVCGARGSTRAYTVLIEAFGAAGKPEEAGRVFADMLNARTRPTVAAFTALLEAYGRNGKQLEAESTFQKMEKRNMEPTPRAWAALIGAYGRGGWFKKAKDTFAEMRRRGYQPGLIGYAALIESFGQGGFVREAAAALWEMRQVCKLEPDREVCTAVLSAIAKSDGNWAAAGPLLKALGGAAEGDVAGTEGACGLALPAHSVLTSPEAGELVWAEVGRAVGGLAKLGRDKAESWANVLLDAMWSLGLRKRAGRLVELARGFGLYGSALVVTSEEWALDVRGLSVGGAEAMLLMWLGEVVIEFRRPQAMLPYGLAVFTGAGQEVVSGNGSVSGSGAVRRAVMTKLAGLGAPFVVSREDDRRLVAGSGSIREWLSKDAVVQSLALRDVQIPVELLRMRNDEQVGLGAAEAKRGPRWPGPGWRGKGMPAMVPSY